MNVEQEFNDLFVKDAGTINATLLNAPSTILDWIQENFTPKVSRVELPVKPANGVTITDLKQGQNVIKIYGHEWYDNGMWKLEIFDPFDELIFKYKINDRDSDKDYTFEEFLEEAMGKYNESRLSV